MVSKRRKRLRLDIIRNNFLSPSRFMKAFRDQNFFVDECRCHPVLPDQLTLGRLLQFCVVHEIQKTSLSLLVADDHWLTGSTGHSSVSGHAPVVNGLAAYCVCDVVVHVITGWFWLKHGESMVVMGAHDNMIRIQSGYETDCSFCINNLPSRTCGRHPDCNFEQKISRKQCEIQVFYSIIERTL